MIYPGLANSFARDSSPGKQSSKNCWKTSVRIEGCRIPMISLLPRLPVIQSYINLSQKHQTTLDLMHLCAEKNNWMVGWQTGSKMAMTMALFALAKRRNALRSSLAASPCRLHSPSCLSSSCLNWNVDKSDINQCNTSTKLYKSIHNAV